MKVKSEVYKGIEFVRVSSLPVEQKEKIKATLSREKIIKILRDEEIISDCIQYKDYLEWFTNEKSKPVVTEQPTQSVPVIEAIR